MIVIIQIQRLLWNVFQPSELLLKLTPPTDELELPPYHLKKNMKMNSATAPPPTIQSARRRRFRSKLIAQIPPSRY